MALSLKYSLSAQPGTEIELRGNTYADINHAASRQFPTHNAAIHVDVMGWVRFDPRVVKRIGLENDGVEV